MDGIMGSKTCGALEPTSLSGRVPARSSDPLRPQLVSFDAAALHVAPQLTLHASTCQPFFKMLVGHGAHLMAR